MRRVPLTLTSWQLDSNLFGADVSISEYGWKIDDGIICPSIDSGPLILMNVISCHSRMGKRLKKTPVLIDITVKNSALQCTASTQQVMYTATNLPRKRRRWRRMMTSMAMDMMMLMKNVMSYKTIPLLCIVNIIILSTSSKCTIFSFFCP